jgi:hypothetical protein
MKSMPAHAQRTTLRYARKPSSLARRRRRAIGSGTLLLAAIAIVLVAWTWVVASRVSEPFARLFAGDDTVRALSARTAALERRTEELQRTVDALRADAVHIHDEGPADIPPGVDAYIAL